MDRNIDIAADLNGNKVVVINDIIFKGKRNVQWKGSSNTVKTQNLGGIVTKRGLHYLFSVKMKI